MEAREAIGKAKETLLGVMDRELSSVTGVVKTEEGWRVTVELVERKSIPDTQDVLGVYEVRLDEDGHLAGYERVRVRRRTDLEAVVE